MKSENQIIVQCKQPIKIEKPLQNFIDIFLHRWWKKYSSYRFVVIFSVFIPSMPSKVIIIVIEFMFLGINIFWALLRANFNPPLMARAKMSLSRAQNIFMPANINSIVLLLFWSWWKVIKSVDSFDSPDQQCNWLRWYLIGKLTATLEWSITTYINIILCFKFICFVCKVQWVKPLKQRIV